MADDETPADGTPTDVPAPVGLGRDLTNRQMKMIRELLDRSERAYGRFKLELVAYNIGCLAAIVLTIYSAVRTAGNNFDVAAMGVYLTSGGLFTVTGVRITKFLSDDLKTIRQIIFAILGRAV